MTFLPLPQTVGRLPGVFSAPDLLTLLGIQGAQDPIAGLMQQKPQQPMPSSAVLPVGPARDTLSPSDRTVGNARTLANTMPQGPRPERLKSIDGPMPQVGRINELDTSSLPGDALGNLTAKKPGHKGLFPGKDWKAILGIVSDGLLGAAGRPAMYAPMMERRRELEQEQDFNREKWAAELDAKRQERLMPKIEQVGNTIGTLDPSAGSYSPFYSAPEPFEAYARARGFEPGTLEFAREVENYRLGAWSDPAVAAKGQLQDDRLRSGERNTDVRAGVSRENNIRSTSTIAANSRRTVGNSRANALTASHDRRMSPAFAGKGNSPTGRTATNKATGEKLRELSDGRWVPIQ